MSDSSRRPYPLCISGEPLSITVDRGPSASNKESLLRLLFDEDNEDWLRMLSDGSPAQVVRVIDAMEKRFRAQRFLLPQLDLMRKRQVPDMPAFSHLAPLIKAARSRLTRFEPLRNASAYRAVFEYQRFRMSAIVSVDPRYPQVTPSITLQLDAQQLQSQRKLPAYVQAVLAEAEEQVPPVEAAYDPQFQALEAFVNNVQACSQPNLVLSYQMTRLHLCFELYVAIKLQDAPSKALLLAAGASVRGRDRALHIPALG